MRAARLFAAGTMTAPRPLRHVALGERLILSGFVIGGAAGFAYHSAQWLVAGMFSALLWCCE